MTGKIITRRLTLRRWGSKDRIPFATINSDPAVMEFMPTLLTRGESNELAQKIEEGFAQYGFGLFAVETNEDNRFIGFLGLSVPQFEAHFTPCIEIGWRLCSSSWNQGYATEGAKAVLQYAFTDLGLQELVAFTACQNIRSRRVMEKIGMTHYSKDDFDHPLLADDSPLKKHVLYRIKRC